MLTTTPIIIRLRKRSPECDAMVAAVNQGIDSRLQAVTQSRFDDCNTMLECRIHPDDCAVIIRRLRETGGPGGRTLADKIRTMLSTEAPDEFTVAYIQAALWSGNDDNDDPLEDNFDITDIAPEAMATITADCRKFQEQHGIPEYHDSRYTDAEKAGHDFWLTRNGHGAGFWGRDELGEDDKQKYTDAAEAFGNQDIYVGDDGKLYVS